MPIKGIPVRVVASGGIPVKSVTTRAPLMTTASNGRGIAVTLTNAKKGAPFIVQDGAGNPVT